jgi:hypothetical protein
MHLEFDPFLLHFPVYFNIDFGNFHLVFICVYCDIPFFIFKFIILGVFSSVSDWLRVCRCYLFEETTVFIIECTFFVSISMISALIFIISLYIIIFSLAYYCFSKSLKCIIRLFIWDFSLFLIQLLIAIKIPFSTLFTASNQFW